MQKKWVKRKKKKEKKNSFVKKIEVGKAIRVGRPIYLILFKGPSAETNNLEHLSEAFSSLL